MCLGDHLSPPEAGTPPPLPSCPSAPHPELRLQTHGVRLAGSARFWYREAGSEWEAQPQRSLLFRSPLFRLIVKGEGTPFFPCEPKKPS